MNHKTLVILEGPAGCGKSMIATELAKTGILQRQYPSPLVNLERPRDYGVHTAFLAHLRDEVAITSALLSHKSIIAIDRWIISPLIYNAIRERGNLRASYIQHAAILGFKHIKVVKRLLELRGGQVYGDKIGLLLCFILPGHDELKFLRKTSGKAYPFSVEEELRHYRYAADVLAMQEWPGEVVRIAPVIKDYMANTHVAYLRERIKAHVRCLSG